MFFIGAAPRVPCIGQHRAIGTVPGPANRVGTFEQFGEHQVVGKQPIQVHPREKMAKSLNRACPSHSEQYYRSSTTGKRTSDGTFSAHALFDILDCGHNQRGTIDASAKCLARMDRFGSLRADDEHKPTN
jgi:hypothetical protein